MRRGEIHRIELAVAIAILVAMIGIGNGAPPPVPYGDILFAPPNPSPASNPHLVGPRQDTTPPSTTVQLLGDIGTGGWFISAVTVVLLAEDDTAVASTSYRINGGTPQGYAGPFSIDPDGTYTLEYWSVDMEGNAEVPRSASVRIDTTPPSIVEISPTGVLIQSEVTLAWHATDATSGVDSYDISVDSGSFQPQGRLESRTLSLSDGVHTLRVRARDAAGLSSESQVTFRIDTSLLSITGPRSSLVYILAFGANAGIVGFIWFVRRRKRR